MITLELAKKLIANQFPEYANLDIVSVEKQGHDNRTYRLGADFLIRMPVAGSYALKVPTEHKFLPKLASQLSVIIPEPIKMGAPSKDYPYPFSIYKWLEGQSANHLTIYDPILESIALQLANFWLFAISRSIEMTVNKVYSGAVNLKIYRKTSKNEPISTPTRHQITSNCIPKR